ncbi:MULTISPECIES: polyprenyl synthetase family protein [unclassified Exiguobacterium]|uniref:polyprenyl synthetase family protein n=1 Tax=unclassified Exiguobacterium TaxID=2644629 RepID=UPI0010405E93|nr:MULTISPECIES: farnesyl diphosphate synthase [unclassified Exiguobacterium]TCI72576.1 polyprenyl synthetase family protein [Exiguobacterium sp. IPCI3]TCI81976.1 polyprenyl synthetase family protein [Exiguobacterium sp. IPCH1]TCI83481.1 polyprenyl synthetase family protein [Exiguobacterium sp. IPBC4]
MSAHIYLQEWKQEVETATRRLIDASAMPERLFQSMTYSLEAGGKRIRPALLYAVLDTYGRPRTLGHEAAVALEMVHTYSLIHDDLPAMDDDDVRRGRPTNHRQFDEATAILAGDALLTDAFRILAQAELEPVKSVALISRFSEAAGSAGMVGGQLDDMLAEKRSGVTLSTLQSIHERKTGALLVYALEAGAILADAPSADRQALVRFGKHLGVAFQIQDDILDVEGDEALIGKRVGSDEGNDKATYPKLLGLDGAKQALEREVVASEAALAELSVEAPRLRELLDFVVQRNH